jgi:hypothetical protein
MFDLGLSRLPFISFKGGSLGTLCIQMNRGKAIYFLDFNVMFLVSTLPSLLPRIPHPPKHLTGAMQKFGSSTTLFTQTYRYRLPDRSPYELDYCFSLFLVNIIQIEMQ